MVVLTWKGRTEERKRKKRKERRKRRKGRKRRKDLAKVKVWQ